MISMEVDNFKRRNRSTNENVNLAVLVLGSVTPFIKVVIAKSHDAIISRPNI